MISLCPQAISGHITFKGPIIEINNAIGINIDPVCFRIRGIPISCLNAVRPLQYSKVSITYKANIALVWRDGRSDDRGNNESDQNGAR
jgi:hypothetical protein